MKKVFAMMLALALAAAMVACGGSSSSSTSSEATSESGSESSSVVTSESTGNENGIVDGTYTAEATEASHGWTDTLTVTYEGGVIVDAKYDAFNEEGAFKSETTAETYPMDFHPTEWIPMINETIVAKGTSADFEMIAGATSSSNNAQALLAAIEENAAAGNTEKAQVALGE